MKRRSLFLLGVCLLFLCMAAPLARAATTADVDRAIDRLFGSGYAARVEDKLNTFGTNPY
ncbi:MAG: hypothetical protein FJZ97_13770 [Chloroflexi bacterium]|nr:hypothetical protein [Chloroflexota bacterium]